MDLSTPLGIDCPITADDTAQFNVVPSPSSEDAKKKILTERFVKHLASRDRVQRLRETRTSQPQRAANRSTASEQPGGERMWDTSPCHPTWANHTTRQGRQKLDTQNFPRIWETPEHTRETQRFQHVGAVCTIGTSQASFIVDKKQT